MSLYVERDFSPEITDSVTVVADVLTQVAERIDAIDQELSESTDHYSELVVERATLIRDLPSIMDHCEEHGITVPIGVRWQTNEWSQQAEQHIQDNYLDGMQTLLSPEDSTFENPQPTKLHRFVAQLHEGHEGGER